MEASSCTPAKVTMRMKFMVWLRHTTRAWDHSSCHPGLRTCKERLKVGEWQSGIWTPQLFPAAESLVSWGSLATLRIFFALLAKTSPFFVLQVQLTSVLLPQRLHSENTVQSTECNSQWIAYCYFAEGNLSVSSSDDYCMLSFEIIHKIKFSSNNFRGITF